MLGALLPALLERQGAMLLLKDVGSGRYVWVSPAMVAWLGLPADQVRGRTDVEIFEGAVAASLRAADQTALSHGEGVFASEHKFDWHGVRQELSVLRAVTRGEDGRRWLCSLWTDQRAHRGREAQLRTALEQLEQQQRANEQLRRELQEQSVRDRVTGLYSRGHFDDQLRREVDLSTREHREFSMVLIGLDPPTDRVRDRGEQAQERVLEAVGRLLRSNTRAMDASSRIDEQRFAVLLSGVGLATAHARMEGLRRQCATQIVVLDGEDLGFTVSMGVASFPHTAVSQADLVDACETALTEARRRGGNQVTLASIRFDAE
ncbi:GGDEF domain-containing protein [Aquabacterium sp. J223]|uniref:GGDEF domain-containing protein n=1 Tax=Aquabacterium sp. J223 TaxID=2898431 RepID=UPI0021AD9114|nr:sensor domain-containing diguanylate cyclase [Aquabacterium sp. J223]UUX97637.1 GGDEF domain-containing protein [Aquabacterium sp. J223]